MSLIPCRLLLLITLVAATPSLKKSYKADDVVRSVDVISNGGNPRNNTDFGDDPKSKFVEVYSHILFSVCDLTDTRCVDRFILEMFKGLYLCPVEWIGAYGRKNDRRLCLLEQFVGFDKARVRAGHTPIAENIVTIKDLITMAFSWKKLNQSTSAQLTENFLFVVYPCVRTPPTSAPTVAPEVESHVNSSSDSYLSARQCVKDILDQGGFDDSVVAGDEQPNDKRNANEQASQT